MKQEKWSRKLIGEYKFKILPVFMKIDFFSWKLKVMNLFYQQSVNELMMQRRPTAVWKISQIRLISWLYLSSLASLGLFCFVPLGDTVLGEGDSGGPDDSLSGSTSVSRKVAESRTLTVCGFYLHDSDRCSWIKVVVFFLLGTKHDGVTLKPLFFL